MRRPRAFLVALVLLLAGCSGVVGDAGPETPRATVTPAPVPDTETDAPPGGIEADDAALPPGVAENGSVDLAALFAAHNEYLSNRSYRLNATRDAVQTRDGDRRVRNTSARAVLESETRYRITTIEENASVRRTEFVNGTDTYEREVRNGSVSTGVTDSARSFEWHLEPSFFHLDRPVLGPRDANVTEIERGNRTLYRIYVPAYPNDEMQFREYSATLYVTPDGLVRTFAFERGYSFGDSERYVRERYSFSDVGTADLSEPDWVTDLKRNRTTPTDPPDAAAPSA